MDPGTRPAVVITTRLPAAVMATLEDAVDVVLIDTPLAPAALREQAPRAQGLLALLTDTIDGHLLEAVPELRVVANVAVGYNNIDLEATRARGVVVTNTPDVLTDATADLAWAMTLALTRRIAEGERLLRRGAWKGWALDFLLGRDVRGRQLGIVGYGRIGRAVGARAEAFGMRVVHAARTASAGGDGMPLDRLLATSDVVSLHVPLTEATRHLIDQAALARMKRTAYLVNTSRGPVVDEAALAWALRNRMIAGAALDVYEREPVVHPDLLDLENVLLVPHLGSATVETRTAMADLAARNVVAVLGGQPALTPVA
jgi:glyoxylate reductase